MKYGLGKWQDIFMTAVNFLKQLMLYLGTNFERIYKLYASLLKMENKRHKEENDSFYTYTIYLLEVIFIFKIKIVI